MDHPCRKAARPLFVEGGEDHIDHTFGIGRAAPVLTDDFRDRRTDLRGEVAGQRHLQFGRRAEMMQQVGMGAAHARGDSLERDCLRPGLDEKRARRLERGRPAFLGAETFANY